jgi:hypothetical protein
MVIVRNDENRQFVIGARKISELRDESFKIGQELVADAKRKDEEKARKSKKAAKKVEEKAEKPKKVEEKEEKEEKE